MQKHLLTLIFLAINLSELYSQSVSDANFQKVGNNIEITYKLSGLKYNQVCWVDVVVSTDGGLTYSKPLQFVKGDVGTVETNGYKKVVWSVFDEFDNFEGSVFFKINAKVEKKKIPYKPFACYSFSPYSPFGLMFGGVAIWGGYIRVNTNGKFTQNDFSYKNGTVTDYFGDGYYAFDNTKEFSVYGFSIGGIRRLTRIFYVYAGAGYAEKNLLWHIDEFSYVDFQKTGDAWVKNSDKSISGIDFEVGGMYNYKKLLITCGASTFNGSEWEVVAGVGFML